MIGRRRENDRKTVTGVLSMQAMQELDSAIAQSLEKASRQELVAILLMLSKLCVQVARLLTEEAARTSYHQVRCYPKFLRWQRFALWRNSDFLQIGELAFAPQLISR